MADVGADLSPAASAFDAAAASFDRRFGPWLSVAAQRRAVRAALAEAFAPGSTVVEIGGGTGEDACWLIDRGRDVILTDPSPQMVAAAAAKLASHGAGRAHVAEAENLDPAALGVAPGSLDGAYSNFAALNCVADLEAFARGLARLLRPGAPALLVLFGTMCPGEMLVEGLRGRPRNMFRRLHPGAVPARLGGRDFAIRYHRASAIKAAMAPWFDFQSAQAIGMFVPPSAAEPWISRHPKLLAGLEALDRRLSHRFAGLGDHVLYRFTRTAADATPA